MWTSLKHILLGFAWLVASVPVLIISWFYGIVAVQNATYARLAFGPFYGIERVVASKRWLGHGENFGCSYAVVKLTSVRSDELVVENNFPALFREQLEYSRFRDVDWGATPRNLHLEKACYFEGMSNADKQTILDGLNETGGWAGEHKYGTRLFFLPKQNFIGIMHFGDRSAYSRLVVRTLLAVISVSDALKCATGNYRRCREWLGH